MTTKRVLEHLLPISAIGTERKIISVHFGSDKTGLKAYLQAGLHADEAPGYLVANRLLELLDEADAVGRIAGEIIVVPVANPIGLSQWGTDTLQGRFDASNNINFNRRYYDLTAEIAEKIDGLLGADPKQNIKLIRKKNGEILAEKKPSTEAEALKLLLLTLSHDADIVLDLHCDHQALLHVYMGTALWPAGADLSAQLGAAVTLLADDSGDGPFDEANSKIWWELAGKFSEFPIPPACLSATVELRGIADTEPGMTETDAQNLYLFLQRRGLVEGESAVLPALAAEATPLQGVDYITSPVAGILSFQKKPGDVVRKGEVIAEVINPMTNAGQGEKISIISGASGVFFARCADRFARPGKIVAKVAGTEPLKGKGTNLLTF